MQLFITVFVYLIKKHMKTYSEPLTKTAASEIILRQVEVPSDIKCKVIGKLISMKDVQFLKSFKKSTGLEARLFAPELIQIVYYDNN